VKLWGKAEIEDQLFQPKNDHLLFAYFGVSLQMRRRSLKTEIRARLAMKRKALRISSPIRSARTRRIGRALSLSRRRRASEPAARGRWKVYRFESCGPFGIELLYRRHFAVIAEDGEAWDFARRWTMPRRTTIRGLTGPSGRPRSTQRDDGDLGCSAGGRPRLVRADPGPTL
jgi:hypothetical protein